MRHDSRIVTVFLGLVFAQSTLGQSSGLPVTRRGDFVSPMTLGEFANATSDGLYRVGVRSSVAVSTAAKDVCGYAHEAHMEEVIRGPSMDRATFCSDLPLTVGTDYLVSVYSSKRLNLKERQEVDAALADAGVDTAILLFVKPFWSYSLYTIKNRGERAHAYVVIPVQHVAGATACIARTEQRTTQVSDDPLEQKSAFNHFDWECFSRAVSGVLE